MLKKYGIIGLAFCVTLNSDPALAGRRGKDNQYAIQQSRTQEHKRGKWALKQGLSPAAPKIDERGFGRLKPGAVSTALTALVLLSMISPNSSSSKEPTSKARQNPSLQPDQRPDSISYSKNNSTLTEDVCRSSDNLPTHLASIQTQISPLAHTRIETLVPSLKRPSQKEAPLPEYYQTLSRAQKVKQKVREILGPDGAKRSIVPIAVIDTGFDAQLDDQFYSNKTDGTLQGVHTRKIVTDGSRFFSIMDFGIDTHGHGTWVTGVIAHNEVGMVENGISVAVYDYNKNDKKCSLLELAKEACHENPNPYGITPINLSLGTVDVEKGFFDWELNCKPVLSDLAKSGCLVVKAAGNSGFQVPRTHDPKSPLLFIQSVNKDGEKSAFSSNGVLSARGEDIIVPLLKGLAGLKGSIGCKSPDAPHDCTLKTGTSLAAPIVSGDLTNTFKILQNDPYLDPQTRTPFERLTPENRIE
jgi:subtilisin family serine protease